MTHDYIYIDTTGLQTDNPDAPKDRVPWLASQTDMLAEDWYGVGRTAEKPFEGTVMVHPIRPVPQINVTFNGVPTSFNTDEIRKALENATEACYQSLISTLTD